jgi:hypothetical protein
MRGRKKPIKSLIITGQVYLQYEDDEDIAAAEAGDIVLFLNLDIIPTFSSGDYYKKYLGGSFKADIYDGKTWCPLLLADLCEHKEHFFSKSEIPIDSYNFCKQIIAEKAGIALYRSYRLHYSTYLHEENPFKGKKGADRK